MRLARYGHCDSDTAIRAEVAVHPHRGDGCVPARPFSSSVMATGLRWRIASAPSGSSNAPHCAASAMLELVRVSLPGTALRGLRALHAHCCLRRPFEFLLLASLQSTCRTSPFCAAYGRRDEVSCPSVQSR